MADNNEETTEAAEIEEPVSPDGVLVTVVPDGRGGVRLNVRALGNTTVLEAPTLLALATRQVKAQLGV